MSSTPPTRSGRRTAVAAVLIVGLVVANFSFISALSTFERVLAVQSRIPGDQATQVCQNAARRALDPRAHAEPTVVDLRYLGDNTAEARTVFAYSDRPDGVIRCTFALEASRPPQLTVVDLEVVR